MIDISTLKAAELDELIYQATRRRLMIRPRKVFTLGQETIAFRGELGYAIAQWGYVENHVRNIVMACVSANDRDALAISFHSIENFRAKLKVCDNLVRHRFGTSPHFARWAKAMDKTARVSKQRNIIAHGWHKLYANNTPGERWAIIPAHYDDGKLIHIDGETPPEGAICLRDLIGIRLNFHALTARLLNVHRLLIRGKAPLPESDERPDDPPKSQRIGFQIHAEYGLPFAPKPKKP